MYIDTGSTVNLTCIVHGLNEPPTSIAWTHNGYVSYLLWGHLHILPSSPAAGRWSHSHSSPPPPFTKLDLLSIRQKNAPLKGNHLLIPFYVLSSQKKGNKLRLTSGWSECYHRKEWHHHFLSSDSASPTRRFREIHLQVEWLFHYSKATFRSGGSFPSLSDESFRKGLVLDVHWKA